jgi:hypothetical protein
MELQKIQGDLIQNTRHRIMVRIHEQTNPGQPTLHQLGDFLRRHHINPARTLIAEIQSKRVGARIRNGSRILGPGDPADLDSGSLGHDRAMCLEESRVV